MSTFRHAMIGTLRVALFVSAVIAYLQILAAAAIVAGALTLFARLML